MQSAIESDAELPPAHGGDLSIFEYILTISVVLISIIVIWISSKNWRIERTIFGQGPGVLEPLRAPINDVEISHSESGRPQDEAGGIPDEEGHPIISPPLLHPSETASLQVKNSTDTLEKHTESNQSKKEADDRRHAKHELRSQSQISASDMLKDLLGDTKIELEKPHLLDISEGIAPSARDPHLENIQPQPAGATQSANCGSSAKVGDYGSLLVGVHHTIHIPGFSTNSVSNYPSNDDHRNEFRSPSDHPQDGRSSSGYRTLSGYNTHSSLSNIIKTEITLIDKSYHKSIADLIPHNKKLHVLYVGLTKLQPLDREDPNVYGVRIRDPEFRRGETDLSTYKPSMAATITEVLDVGGVDKFGRGEIKL